MFNESELMSVEELYENDELILMKSTFDYGDFKVIQTDVGNKDDAGDIVKIVTVDSKIVKQNGYLMGTLWKVFKDIYRYSN